MKSKWLGGILLIVGTSVGAGMLALPVANAALGFWPSSVLLLMCWFLMTCGALYMVEASLYVAQGKHLTSMAKVTLNLPGLVLTWFSYVLLLYALLSAFISGGADVFGRIVQAFGWSAPVPMMITGFTLLFGGVVYQGIRSVDLVNRSLMFAKLLVYCALVVLILPKTNSALLAQQPHLFHAHMMMILITSFGFAIIVPNLRDYFARDELLLKRVVWIGSLIPLICYVVWDAMILGTIPTSTLIDLQHSERTTSSLALHLSAVVQSAFISTLFQLFTSICMLTAFLGVALSLMSFLADAFQLALKGREGVLLLILTFFPPWLFVMFYPGAYLMGLSYAGECCVILLLFLPAAMTYFGRPHHTTSWRVPGGKPLQLLVMVSAIVLLILEKISG